MSKLSVPLWLSPSEPITFRKLIMASDNDEGKQSIVCTNSYGNSSQAFSFTNKVIHIVNVNRYQGLIKPLIVAQGHITTLLDIPHVDGIVQTWQLIDAV